MIKDILQTSHKLVIKIGSNTLAKEDGTVDHEFLENLTKQVIFLRERGIQVVIVSSGARIAGVSRTNRWSRKSDIHYKQALCAIGQVELMAAYSNHFSLHNVFIGQLLLTNDDFFTEERSLNIRNTLFTLADEGVVPIINENDTVSVDQIKIGDNDTLSAQVANLWNAGALIILSDVNGLYDKNPKEYPDAKLIQEVRNLDEQMTKVRIGTANEYGTGGILTKIEAARMVNTYGIPMILSNGGIEDVLQKLFEGEQKATLFLPKED